jgi:multidrug efflux system membrane fusion protein
MFPDLSQFARPRHRVPRANPAARLTLVRRSVAPASVRLGLLALGLALALNGCAEKSRTAGRGTGAAPVLVGKVERKPVPLTLDAIGTVEPSRTASVRPQIAGTLLKIDFKEGQQVAEGDLLFEIDPRPFQNALRSAEAELQKWRVQLENARAQSERYRALDAESAISKEQFRAIEDAERSAAAQLLSGEAGVAGAKLQLDYCSIRAPMAGLTGAYGAHEGDLVSSASAAPLVIVNQISPTHVSFGVPQQYLGDIARYRAAGTIAVAATPPGADTAAEKGELIFIDNNVDPSTGTLKLKAAFPNPSRRLWPGQFVAARITLATPDALVIPSAAVQNDQSGQHVFVVKDDLTAEMRPVTVERRNGNDAVIAKGLAEGETVVTDGQLRVTAGKPVAIKAPGAPVKAAAPASAGKKKPAP